jgi:hypothetical protein
MPRKLRLTLASVLAVAALGAIAPAANAYVYFGYENPGSGSRYIARASNDGTKIDRSFLPVDSRPSPGFIALDGSNIFWASPSGDTIAGAKLDGTGVGIPSSVTISGAISGLTVDSDYIYWADDFSGSIGRARRDGTGVVEGSFISAPASPKGVAIRGSFIYWTDRDGQSIGRAQLNGSGAATNVDTSLVSPIGLSPGGIAVDSNYIYWGGNYGDSAGPIGRVNLDGSGSVDLAFISGAGNSQSVSVDSSHIYWTTGDSIGRANLDGTSANTTFIPGAFLSALAVDSLSDPTISAVGKASKTSLKVKIGCGDASACSIRLTGKKVGTNAAITPRTVAVGAGQQPTVTLRYSRVLRKALAKGGRVSVTATNSATGGATSITLRVAR